MKLLELRRINAAEHVARTKAEELVKQNETLMREGDHRLNEQLKYAYAVSDRGNVAVDFEQTTSGWRLEVSDEGRGLPEGFDIDQKQGIRNAGREGLCE
jgi:hypothetical protein